MNFFRDTHFEYEVTVCFGVFFVKAAWVVIQMPGVDEGLAQVGSIQWWGMSLLLLKA